MLKKTMTTKIFLGLFVITLAFFNFLPSVLADFNLINATPSYSGAQWPGSGDYEVSANPTTGYVRAKCWKDSWARGAINEDFTNHVIDVSSFNVQVTIENPYDYENQVLGSTCDLKIWLDIWDDTASTLVYEDTSRDWGSVWYNWNIGEDLYAGHTYTIHVGVWAETSWGWFWQYATAEGYGTITHIVVTGLT